MFRKICNMTHKYFMLLLTTDMNFYSSENHYIVLNKQVSFVTSLYQHWDKISTYDQRNILINEN